MPDLVYLIGPPAAGKSTLMQRLTSGCDRTQAPEEAGVPHSRLHSPKTGDVVAVELGRARGRFPGTDALSMSIAPDARRWIGTVPHDLVLGEGDRLAIASFMMAAKDAGYVVHLVYLHCDPAHLDARCAQRGSAQDRGWRAGRATKALNLAKWGDGHGCRVIMEDSAVMDPAALAARVTDRIPALKELP